MDAGAAFGPPRKQRNGNRRSGSQHMPGVRQQREAAGQHTADDFGNHNADNQDQRDNQAAAAGSAVSLAAITLWAP